MGGDPEVQPAEAGPGPRRPSPPFLVVAVGASAGGLAALEALLSAVPADSGAAYVFVTHQGAGQMNLLPELLARHTTMSVVEVTDGLRLEPNRVHLPPPGKCMALAGETLRVTDPGPGLRLPIDHFFRSLAQAAGPRAVGIVLSGTGTDGTEGVRAIKGEGGVAIAQDERSAQQTGMPRSAAATGLMDHVLSPQEMPAAFMRYVTAPEEREEGPDLPEPLVQRVLHLLRQRTGHDFSRYKPKTVRRRIERRIVFHQHGTLRDYLRYLVERPEELDLLFHELLIGVTSFFRDPGAFESLEKGALSELLAGKPDGHQVRIWVPGCSTGEEPYSLAISTLECIERLGRRLTVQVFATDLNARSIEQARTGTFAAGIAADVPADRLSRFFVEEDGRYRLVRSVRDCVIFATQDVIEDPPFTKLDLISCRNLLIYLEPELQRRLVPLFHYALRPDGLLLLGSSESLGCDDRLFQTLDKKWRIFRRRPTALALPDLRRPRASGPATPDVPRAREEPSAGLAVAADRMLLGLYVPPSVVVTPQGDIVHVRGRTGPYLEPAEGQPSVNVLAMAREGLGPDLVLALRTAVNEGAVVTRRGVRVRTNGDWSVVDVVVRPAGQPQLAGLFLISFEPVTEPAPAAAAAPPPGGQRSALELELQHTRDSLQATVEELEASNEELKSANEELQSTNEELQSTNEEMDTSKEELQSLNEELQAVNAQLHEKLQELSRVNDDMKNLLDSTDIATLFLDGHLRIKRFTPQVRRVIKLIEGDIGRPLGDLASRLEYEHLMDDAAAVLRTLAPKEVEVRGLDGSWFLTRLMPYRTADNRLDGLVITFVDVTPSRRERALVSGMSESSALMPMLLVDRELRVMSANTSYCETFGVASKALEGAAIANLPALAWTGPVLRRIVEDAMTTGGPTVDEGEREIPGLGRRTVRLEARRLGYGSGVPAGVIVTFGIAPGAEGVA